MDGTTSLKWPLFTANFAIVHDPQLIDLEVISFSDLTAYETQTVGILKETCLTVKDRASLLGRQLLTIIEPVTYGMLFLLFILTFLSIIYYSLNRRITIQFSVCP